MLLRECGNTAEAMALHSRLLEGGVDAQLRNESLARRVPKPASQVWVASDQMDKAAKIAELDTPDVERKSAPWICSECGEENPGSFAVCYKCSANG